MAICVACSADSSRRFGHGHFWDSADIDIVVESDDWSQADPDYSPRTGMSITIECCDPSQSGVWLLSCRMVIPVAPILLRLRFAYRKSSRLGSVVHKQIVEQHGQERMLTW